MRIAFSPSIISLFSKTLQISKMPGFWVFLVLTHLNKYLFWFRHLPSQPIAFSYQQRAFLTKALDKDCMFFENKKMLKNGVHPPKPNENSNNRCFLDTNTHVDDLMAPVSWQFPCQTCIFHGFVRKNAQQCAVICDHGTRMLSIQSFSRWPTPFRGWVTLVYGVTGLDFGPNPLAPKGGGRAAKHH